MPNRWNIKKRTDKRWKLENIPTYEDMRALTSIWLWHSLGLKLSTFYLLCLLANTRRIKEGKLKEKTGMDEWPFPGQKANTF